MRRTLLTLALIATASVSYAQQPMRAEPTDPYGRPLVGRNDWVRQPGDQPGPGGAAMQQPGSATNYGNNMATAPQPMSAPPAQPMASPGNRLERDHAIGPEPVVGAGPRQATFKDEYGFRYDSQGNRLDARGNVMSPHIPQR
jgi:hypothetical protein